MLNPHKFDNGLKFREWCGGSATTFAMSFLMVDPSSMGDGGGDARGEFKYCGHWYKNRVVIVGDYSKDTILIHDFPELVAAYARDHEGEQPANLYQMGNHSFRDISVEVIEDMALDENIKDDFLLAGIMTEDGKYFDKSANGYKSPPLSIETRSRILTDQINSLAWSLGSLESSLKDPDIQYSAFTKHLIDGFPARVRNVLTNLENRKTYERD
jgi:hypothetical protein